MRVARSPAWRERCCRFRAETDATNRAGCACPYPSEDYTPAPEAQRPLQEVFLPGGHDRWTGRTCPAAVVREDPLVAFLEATFPALDAWHMLPFPGDWSQQPAWWTKAALIVQAAGAAVDREEMQRE